MTSLILACLFAFQASYLFAQKNDDSYKQRLAEEVARLKKEALDSGQAMLVQPMIELAKRGAKIELRKNNVHVNLLDCHSPLHFRIVTANAAEGKNEWNPEWRGNPEDLRYLLDLEPFALTVDLRNLCSESIEVLTGLSDLTELHIHKYSGADYEKLAGWIGDLKYLESYTIGGTGIAFGDGSLTADKNLVLDLSRLRDVRIILMPFADLDDESFARLLRSWESEEKLDDSVQKTLWLRGTKITDESIDLILNSKKLDFRDALIYFPKSVSTEAFTKLSEAHPTWTVMKQKEKEVLILGKPPNRK